MFDLSQADTNVWPAVDVDSAALLKRACGHEIGSQDHFGSLRRHYPHQVIRVPRKIRGSQPTAPLQETNYSRRLPRRKGIHSVTLSGSVSLFCPDAVGQVAVRESPFTSHFSPSIWCAACHAMRRLSRSESLPRKPGHTSPFSSRLRLGSVGRPPAIGDGSVQTISAFRPRTSGSVECRPLRRPVWLEACEALRTSRHQTGARSLAESLLRAFLSSVRPAKRSAVKSDPTSPLLPRVADCSADPVR